MGAIASEMISEARLIELLQNKHQQLELVLTGRDPSQELIDLSDYYSEITLRKHPYESEGLAARSGIEY